jgi:hypothetical protein
MSVGSSHRSASTSRLCARAWRRISALTDEDRAPVSGDTVKARLQLWAKMSTSGQPARSSAAR